MDSNLTLEQLRAGDMPQMPARSGKGEIKWWQTASIPATNIFYSDFSINKGEMTIGSLNNVVKADLNGLYVGNSVWALANFRVDMSGNTYLTNAVISGQVNATSGVIGGFTVLSDQMYGGIIKTGMNAGAGESGVIMDASGLRGYSDTLGQVFNLPTDGSAPTFSSGVINSTTFNLDTSSVIRTSDTAGDGSADSAGVLINSQGLFAMEANQTPSTANVKILANGEATVNVNVKGGMTDFMVGTGYYIGKSGGVYKLAVGNPGGNYMSWDDSQLRIKGVIELDGPLNLEGYSTVDLPIPPSSVGLTLAQTYS